MSRSLKGEVGEELFAVVFIIALIFVFIMSVLGVYSNYLKLQDTISSSRTASELAEGIFFGNNGVVSEAWCNGLNQTYGNLTGVRIDILYRQGNGLKNCSTGSGGAGSGQSVGAMPILVVGNGNYYPGKVKVYVGTG